MNVRIDGLVVDESTGEIIEGVDELGSSPIESLLLRALTAKQQAKLWEDREKMLRSMALGLMREAGEDTFATREVKAQVRSTESVKRDDIVRMGDLVEITDAEIEAVLNESKQTFNVARFRKACHDRKIPVDVIEKVVSKSVWLDVRPALKEAEPVRRTE